MKKRVVVMMDVDTGPENERWHQQDIALKMEETFENAVVWDNLDDFMADHMAAERPK